LCDYIPVSQHTRTKTKFVLNLMQDYLSKCENLYCSAKEISIGERHWQLPCILICY